VLEISGRTFDVELEITRYDPPSNAETRFETNGIKVVSDYTLHSTGGGTRLTQSLEAKAGGFTAKMLLPVVQPRLEQKLTEDLERLRTELS
jgi:carbon monoxide dehydrogenase subunit G